jgi:drug/metabolite transporter (DMT)-like permease
LSTVNSEYRTYLQMVLTTAFWGGSFIASKIALHEFTATSLLFFRLLIAVAVIFPILFCFETRIIPERGDLVLLFGIGALGISLFFTLQFYAIMYTSASNASIINALNPLISSVLASYIADEYLTRKRIGLILIAFIGVLLTVTNGDLGNIVSLRLDKGSLIMLVATVCFSLYSVFSKKATKKYSPLLVTAYIILFGLLQIAPIMLLTGNFVGTLSFSSEAWLCVGFLAVCSSVIGYLLQQDAIKKIGVNKTVIFNNLVTPFALLFAFIFLGEVISVLNLVSAAMILIAVYLNSRET